MLGYIGFYKDQKCEVYADSLFDAKRKAIEIFQQKKIARIKSSDVSVVLAEKDGKVVTQSTCF